MVKLDKQNRGGRKEEFANFKPSQKEFVGGGKVVRESRLEKKAKKVDEKYGNLEPHQVDSGDDQCPPESGDLTWDQILIHVHAQYVYYEYTEDQIRQTGG